MGGGITYNFRIGADGKGEFVQVDDYLWSPTAERAVHLQGITQVITCGVRHENIFAPAMTFYTAEDDEEPQLFYMIDAPNLQSACERADLVKRWLTKYCKKQNCQNVTVESMEEWMVSNKVITGGSDSESDSE